MLAMLLTLLMAPVHAAGGAPVSYSDDDDGDGIPNWRDAMTYDAPNTETYVVTQLVAQGVNVLVLFGVIGFFARRPVSDFLRDRALGIRKELVDSEEDRKQAQADHDALADRLKALQDEVTQIQKNAEDIAARDEAARLERSKAEAQRILEQAERTIRDETQRARQELRTQAVELAVELAETTLRDRIASNDQRALAEAFLTSVQSKEADHG